MGVAQGLNLTPELPTIGLGVAPAADQIGNIWGQHPGGWRPLQPSGAGWRVAAEVGVDGRAADAQLPGHGGDGRPPRPERPHGLIDRDPAGVPGRPLGLGRCGFGTPAPALIPGCDGHHARGRRERHRRPDRSGLQRRSVIEQEGFQDLTEVLDEVEAVDHLHGRRRPPADAVGVEVAAIPTDDGDRRVLAQPGRHAGSGAVRQQVHDAMRREIDQDGAVAVSPPPGPLVYADDLQGWRRGHRGGPHQAEQGRWTGGEPQASGESGTSIAAESHADGPEDGGQPMGVAGGWRDEVWQALREDTTHAARIAAHELPHDEVDVHHACPPGKVGQVTLVTAMHRGRCYGTTGAACLRRRRRQLKPHGVLFHGDLVQAHVWS
jgi:hypothetical protein